MREGLPFERYPGPPRRDGASFRVISPWRDALAWISIAGPLAVTRYLVREGGGWRDALVETTTERESGDALWTLERRDPIELVFRTIADAGVNAVAYVVVTREACEIHIENLEAERARDLVAVPDHAMVTERDGLIEVEIPVR